MSEIQNLISVARSVQKEFKLRADLSVGGVGAALRSHNGKIYTGICLDLACGLGFCAEHYAIAEMLKDHETQIDTIVAVNGERILPPCGCCREMMMQIDAKNSETKIILSENKIIALEELLPEYWLDAKFDNVLKEMPPEIGGPKGPEPTRYGDWEVKGRVSDF